MPKIKEAFDQGHELLAWLLVLGAGGALYAGLIGEGSLLVILVVAAALITGFRFRKIKAHGVEIEGGGDEH